MSKDKSTVLERMRKRVSPEQREFVKMNLSIARQIEFILKKKGWSQKELAKKVGKHESEISRLLSGLHNISLMSLAKLKVVLEEEIITTPIEACEKYKTVEFIALGNYAKPNKEAQREYTKNDNIKVAYRKHGESLAA